MKLPQLTYYTLGEGVTAFSSTRHGGASVGNYSTFNINLFCGDDAEVVRVNRIALCEELNIAPERLIAKKFHLKPMTNKVMRNNRLKMLHQISLRFLF